MELIHIEVTQGQYKTAKEARRAGQIPMICYANQVEPRQFTVDYQEFRRAFNKAGKSSIITLTAEGKDIQDVIVHEVQYAPVSDDIIHVDLMAIKKGQKISTEVPLVFVGEAPAVRELGGVLMSNKTKLHIECLPKDLPHEIEVDISPLVDFHTSISVGDIKLPETITVLDAMDIAVATAIAPRVEEEATPEAPAEGAEAAGEKPAEGEAKTEETAAKSDE